MKPAAQLRRLLNELATRAPEVYQQLTMPGCGFAAVPADALDDETHDWWNGEAATELLAECYVALDEQPPLPDLAEPEECEDNDCAGCAWCDRLFDAPSPEVLTSMFDWHGGMGCPLYAAASYWHGCHRVKRKVAARALETLERMSGEPNFSEADVTALDALRDHLASDLEPEPESGARDSNFERWRNQYREPVPAKRKPDLRPGRKVTAGDLRRLEARQTTHHLYCPRCNETYSADARDYFNRPDHVALKCCGVNNWLISKR